jgi:hypothetical protein
VTPQGKRVAELVHQLTHRNIRPSDCVHLDPDIRPELRSLECRELPLTFGQDSGSQTELKELIEGDLFLFFGWFRKAQEYPTGSFRFSDDGADIHSIWGWLQIAEKLDLQSKLSRAQKIASHHPHVSHHGKRKNNCLYVASDTLTFLPNRAGAGTFSKFHDGLSLSDMQSQLRPQKRSYWRLPAFFKQMTVSRIPKISDWDRVGDSILGRAAYCPGQEFVFKTNGHKEEIAKWLDGIFAEGDGIFS